MSRLSARIALILGLTALALAGGCSEGNVGPKECVRTTDCPVGYYCGNNKTCTFDCLKPSDCPGGTCGPIGKCVGGTPDASPDALAPDGAVDSGTKPEQPKGDLAKVDVQPKPDQAKPDSGKVDAAKTDGPKTDAPKTDAPTDAPKTDGPKTDAPKTDAPKTDGPKTDAPKTDAPKTDAPPACGASIGAPCTQSGGQCGAGTCVLTSATAGFCTCPCAPDDPQTPLVNEDSCPNLAQNVCGSVVYSNGQQQNICLRTCQPKLGASDCGAPLACEPSSGWQFGLYSKAVCAFSGCKGNADCPVLTATVCSVVAANCATGTCLSFAGGDEGRCALPGSCDLTSGLCAPHSLGNAAAKVGDPCKADTDCAGNMICQLEFDKAKYQKKGGVACSSGDECCSGACNNTCTAAPCPLLYRNGYCTVPGCAHASLTAYACPAGSACNRLYAGGQCQRTCKLDTASDCRGVTGDYLGDYECRSWDGLIMDGQQIASAPVCDYGPMLPCSTLASSGVSCSDLGNYPTNNTKMSCRTLDNKTTSSLYDPQGYCLDDTSSGTQTRANPLP